MAVRVFGWKKLDDCIARLVKELGEEVVSAEVNRLCAIRCKNVPKALHRWRTVAIEEKRRKERSRARWEARFVPTEQLSKRNG